MAGPQPIALSEIVAWCSLNGRNLAAADLEILRTLDAEFRAAQAEAAPEGDADDDWSRD